MITIPKDYTFPSDLLKRYLQLNPEIILYKSEKTRVERSVTKRACVAKLQDKKYLKFNKNVAMKTNVVLESVEAAIKQSFPSDR